MKFKLKMGCLLIAISSLCAFSNSFAAELKVGIINRQILMQDSLLAKDVQKRLQREFGERREHLEAKDKQLRLKHEALQRDKDIMSKEERRKREKEMAGLQSEFQTIIGEYEMDFNKRQEQESEDFAKVLRAVLDDIAAAEKLDLIIPKSMTMYNNGRADYTHKVLNALDKKFKSSKARSKR